jgi:hypothetical protein
MVATGLRLKEIGTDPDNPHRAFVKLKDLDGRWELTEVIAYRPVPNDPKSVYWDTGSIPGVVPADEYLTVCKLIARAWV